MDIVDKAYELLSKRKKKFADEKKAFNDKMKANKGRGGVVQAINRRRMKIDEI